MTLATNRAISHSGTPTVNAENSTLKPMMKLYLAEVFGTFCLVLAGCGAMVVNDVTGGTVGHVGVCLTFGLIVLAMIYSIGDVSGAHINPAVTIGFWAAGRLPASRLAPYIVSQCLGALLACGFLRLQFPDHPTLGATLPAGTALQAATFEVLLTAILMFVILSVTTGAKEKGITVGIVVGSVVTLAALFAGPVTGASMNPARSLGPAVVSGKLADLWIYLVACPLGALLAVGLCRVIHTEDCCCEPARTRAAS